MENKDIVKKVATYCSGILKDKLDVSLFKYHNFNHVKDMKSAAMDIASSYQLGKEELEDLEIACWFHDIGYAEGMEGHERRSVAVMETFLTEQNYAPDRIQRISGLIMATEKTSNPQTLLQQIIKDADCFHVGTKQFFEKTALLRAEMELILDRPISEKEWFQENLKFLHKQAFITNVAASKYNDRKRKNILKVQKQLTNLVKYENNVVELDPDKADISQRLADNRADRGIETMFRVTLRNHNNLSVIADNKANIMLSINSIMLSIVLSSLASKLDTNPTLMIPTVILTLVCVFSIILAVLATRPKISKSNYSDEAFLNKKFNMLFFGNFYFLPLEKFEWGIKTLMNNEDMLYTNLTQDLYYLGLVLAKKYRLLFYCYNVFAVGIIITAIAFIWAFAHLEVPSPYIIE